MKTIFFSFSSQPVFRNLFLLPGSVFELIQERLRQDQNLRVVFFIPEDQIKKYSHVFDGVRGTRCIVDAAPYERHLSVSQRIFRFFYSYLIYTSTTRLLATMGTRPDEMPPGGRWLAPLKWLIASTFGRSSILKTKFIPVLFDVFFPNRYFTAHFDAYKPDLVFFPHLMGWFDLLLLREARAHGVKTVGMTANWDHADKYFIPLQADHVLSQSRQVKTTLVRCQGYQPDRVSVVGYPYFDFIWRKEFLMPRDGLLRTLAFPSDSKYILYVSGSVYCPDEPEVIEMMLRWADEGKFGHDTRVVIRPYLGGRLKDRAFDEKKYDSFAAHPRVFVYKRESWSDLDRTVQYLNIMAHADVVVSAFSTAALEVSVLDRPLISVGFDGHHHRPYHRSVRRFEQFSHFRDIFALGAVRATRSFPELLAAIKAYLDDSKLDADKRARLQQAMCGPLDGRASERVLDFLFSNV